MAMRPENDLDALFDLARNEAMRPADTLLERVHAQALAEMPRPPSTIEVRRPQRQTGSIRSQLAWLFGLGAATAAGVMLGLFSPSILDDARGIQTYSLGDLLPETVLTPMTEEAT